MTGGEITAGHGRILIVGVTSSIARALAAEYARDGYDLMVTGRDPEELSAVASDLALRYRVEVEPRLFDALDFADHEALMREACDGAGVIVALGTMGDPAELHEDFEQARLVLDTNYTACVSLLERAASCLEPRGEGFICAIGSVSGDRGRQSNYLYGSAKAGLDAYLQGLRNRLYKAGVTVTTIKPGFVDTRMTYGKPGVFMVASPESVARGIHRAVGRGRNEVYLPWFWRPLMWAIRSIPEPVFKRMNL